MSKRTKLLLGIGVIAALVIGWQVAAFAVHDTGVFELDGNATDDPTVPGDDWDTATAKTFISEPNLNATIFTGGGSKDPQDISNWAWKDGAGGLPDKDNLLDAYAVRYDTSEGNVLYFGADRYDNSGDAQLGFWFLQDEVALGTNSIGGGTGFTGVHTEGDILVVTDFSNGGTVSTITVYEWDTTCTKTTGSTVGTCGDANLRILATSTSANCTNPNPDTACGIVNNQTITLPWTFNDKTPGGTNTALIGEFYEGGINLTELGLADECFSSFAVETRSSTSTTATLKDFILGEFESCAPGMTTQASKADGSAAGTVTPGTAVTDTATITITGATSPDDPTGDVTFFLCGPLAASDEGCPTGQGTNVGTGTLDGGTNTTDGIATATSPVVNVSPTLAPGRYCFRAEWPGDANYDAISHTDNAAECFTVQDTTAITTAQKWLPQDEATVTTASGAAPEGEVTFKLYNSADCTGDVVATFTDSSAPYETNNDVYRTADSTISWKATFAPTNGATGSEATCETSTLDITN